MPKTFNPNLPTDKDWVRLLTGDRDISVSPISDEEIYAILAAEGNKYLAAYRVGMLIHGQRRDIISEWVDDLRVDYDKGEAGKAYLAYLQQLRKRGLKPGTVFRVLGTDC